MCRVPIASVTWNDKQQMQKTGGAYISLFPINNLALRLSQASQLAYADDYWLLTGSGYSLPAQVTITSVLGDIVTGSPRPSWQTCLQCQPLSLAS